MTCLNAVLDARPEPQKIEWIQALRGIACILVVLTHARYFFLNTPEWSFADRLLLPGAAGVDLFFVISGFIMAHTTFGAQRHDAGSFIRKRLLRIWPPYAVMVILWLFLLGSGITAFSTASATVWRSLFFLPVDPKLPPFFGMLVPVGWTLVFELYFYAIFALSMLFGRYRWIALFSWVALSVIVIPMSARGLDLDVRRYLGYSLYANVATNAFVIEFLFGVIAAFVYRSSLRITSPRLCWNILALVVASAVWACTAGVLPFHGPLGWGFAAGMIVLTLAVVCKTVHISAPPLVKWLGTISYSLYLTHTLTQQMLIRWMDAHQFNYHAWDFVIASTCVCSVLGYAYYELVETRLVIVIRQLLTGPDFD